MTHMRLKYLAQNVVEKSNGKPAPYIGLEDLGSGSGRLIHGGGTVKSDSMALFHRSGDVLFGKLRPYLAKSYLANSSGIGTGELLVIRPGSTIDSRFLFYSTLSASWLEWAEMTSYGTKMPRTSWEAMSEFRLWVPSLEGQRRIADFLDAEVTRIDRVVKLRRAQSELLSGKVWSFFQGLVDDSGGGYYPLRRVVDTATDGPFGSAFSSSDYVDSGVKVIRLGNIGFGEYKGGNMVYLPAGMFERFRSYSVLPGDLLVAGLGDAKNHAGRACVAPDALGPTIVKGKCFRLRFTPGLVDPYYMSMLLSSPLGKDSMEGRGSTRSMINLDIVKSAFVPIPEISAQLDISRKIREFRKDVSSTLSLLGRQEILLEERKRALITAAVTGQIDVTTARGADLS